MIRHWMFAGLMGIWPLLSEASWLESSLVTSAGQVPGKAASAKDESAPMTWIVQPPDVSVTDMTVVPGDTLAGMLQRLGLDAATRAKAVTALSREFDLAKLQPGHRVSVATLITGPPVSVAIERESGVRYVVTLGQQPRARTLQPRTDIREFAREIEIESSVSALLAAAKVPARFAAELETLLTGIVDTDRDMNGGGDLRLLWEESRRQNGSRIGPPRLTYAALDMRAERVEVVWPGNRASGATVFMDGERLRSFRFPVQGARLTSAFGNRRHPVYGGIRQHDGIDLAAPKGTSVVATAPGRISYLGWRGGYGRVVEIDHESGAVSRYTHLSRFAEGLAVGDWVENADRIGAVGATGLTTGPNLHFEVRLEGSPVDPLDDGMRIIQAEDATAVDALSPLAEARMRLERLIDVPNPSGLTAYSSI